MLQLIKNFNTVFPAFQTTEFQNQCTITEKSNSKTDKFQQLTLTGIDGFQFPQTLAADMSRFANSAHHNGMLTKDCDGIFTFEHKGLKYIIICELKSTFDTTDISYANSQIIGSYVKLVGVLSTLQNFSLQNYNFIGIIASFEPTQEQLTTISKDLSKWDVSFSFNLQHRKISQQTPTNCQKFYKPLNVPGFTIHYIPVPNRQSSFTINLPSLLGI